MAKQQNFATASVRAGRAHPAAALLMVAALAAPGLGHAEETRHNYDIPAQSLNNALMAFAAESGLELIFTADKVRGLSSQRLSGNMTAEQGLDRLLAGSGVSYRFVDARTVTLQAARRAAKPRPAAPPPKSAPPDDGAAVTLPTVKVTAEATGAAKDDPQAYNITHTAVGTKTDTPIMEAPVNIQVVPQQILKDQQAVRVDKALENVSGVFVIPGGLVTNNFSLRGFDSYIFYRDGVRVNNGYLATPFRDTTNVEQIEVLKGPASILYGRLEPGGLINVTTKQPLAAPYYSLQQQIGSYSFHRTTLDATGPVTQDGSLLYRFNAGYEDSGSFIQYADNQRVLVAPKLQWNISEQTQANFYLEYLHSQDPTGGFIPAVGNRPADVPRGLNLGEAGGRKTTDDIRFGFNWSHAFNDRWTLRHYFDTNIVSNPTSPGIFPSVLSDPANCTRAGCPVSRYGFSAPLNDTNIYYTSLNLTGKVDTWMLKHTLLMGWDYLNTHQDASFAEAFSVPGIDLFNPVHTGSVAGLLDVPDYASKSTFNESWNGLYLQDQVKLPYEVHVLAGFRYDNASLDQTGYDLLAAPGSPPTYQSSQQETAVKPRFGLLWQALPALTVYGNYVENFGLTNGKNVDGSLLPPTTAQQYEAGIKTELFDQRFTGSLAWFDITKQNIATPDPDPARAAQGYASTSGEVRNEGVELDLAGEVWPGVKMIGSFAYINSRITKDRGLDYANPDANGNPAVTTGNQGHRYFGVPRYSGSLWATYEPQMAELRGLKVGAGVVARGQRESDNANDVQLPGYAVFNMMASYGWKMGRTKLTAQLNADNLLDKTYYNPGNGPQTLVAAPRTFLGSIRVEF